MKRIKQYVIVIDNERLEQYKIKYIKNGVIHINKHMPEYSTKVAKVYLGLKARYYVVGEMSPTMIANLEDAQALFMSKYFRALVKARFTLTEWLMIFLTGSVITMVALLYIKLMEMFNYLNI